MKRFYLLLLGLLLFGTTALTAQDVIVRKDGTTILAKVQKVGESSIEYRKWDNLEGPTYSLPTSSLQAINYQNGTRDTFNTPAPAPAQTTTTKTAPAVASAPQSNTSNWYRDEKWFVMNQDFVGFRFGIDDEGLMGNFTSIIVGWNLGRFFSAGFGLEYFNDVYYDNSVISLYGDICWYMLGKRVVTPFFDLRLGFSSLDSPYFREALGLAIKNVTLSVGFGAVDFEKNPMFDVSLGWHISF